VCRGHLDCDALYYGGGLPGGNNLPAFVPELGLSYSKVGSCAGNTVNLVPTTSSEVPGPGCSTPAGTPTYGERHCTSPGCLLGAPLAIPNPQNTATGICVHNVIANRPGVGTGTATCCPGSIDSLVLPLDSRIFLTGAVEHVKVCSVCAGGTPGVCGSGTCMSGPRDGLSCTPETSPLNGSYPTSHDCPPPNAPATATCGTPSGTFIGCLPIDFNLSTGTQTMTRFDPNGVTDPGQGHDRTFCGFCFDNTTNFEYRNPPQPCDMDSDCVAGDICRQHSDGAFRNIFATTITETGTPANACLADAQQHPATLVSVFCIPPTYDGIVDPSSELPGPGAVSLPGTVQLVAP
jgi:hypothetical protein